MEYNLGNLRIFPYKDIQELDKFYCGIAEMDKFIHGITGTGSCFITCDKSWFY